MPKQSKKSTVSAQPAVTKKPNAIQKASKSKTDAKIEVKVNSASFMLRAALFGGAKAKGNKVEQLK